MREVLIALFDIMENRLVHFRPSLFLRCYVYAFSSSEGSRELSLAVFFLTLRWMGQISGSLQARGNLKSWRSSVVIGMLLDRMMNLQHQAKLNHRMRVEVP